jgi:type IX secretion system substrate protein
MRKLTLLLLFVISAVHAQKGARDSENDIAMVDTKAPIGLDLMAGKKSGITVYPNATNDHILISVAGKAYEGKTISISDCSGRQVFHSGKCNENTYLVDVSGFRKDLYIVEVSSGSKVYRKKWLRN